MDRHSVLIPASILPLLINKILELLHLRQSSPLTCRGQATPFRWRTMTSDLEEQVNAEFSASYSILKRPEDEAEKTRLSLLEDKLTDSLTFLLQLPNKNVSHMALEKIVMNSLGVCSKPDAAGSPLGLQVADTLCIHLTSSDLPKGSGEEDKEGGHSGEKHLLPPLGCQTNNVNSLLISG